jgi:hypothetical protein
MIVLHTCPTCIHCGEQATLEVDSEALENYRAGALAQVAFPDMSRDDRELFISGIHPKCWNEMFPDE